MKRFLKNPLTYVTIAALTVSLGSWACWRPAKRFEPGAPQANQLRVATWNVGYFAPVPNKNLRDTDIHRIAETILAIDPDVIVLQELGEIEQAAAIAGHLGDHWWHQAVKTGHGEQVIAILSDTLQLDIESFQCGGRTSLGATLQTQNGEAVYVVGVHSPHPARGIRENRENIEQALFHAKNQDEGICIITGDMNYNFDPDGTDVFYRQIMTDFGDGTVDLGETYYAHTRIDHMFHYPRNLQVAVDQSGIVDLPMRFSNVPGFRDHRPIVVTYNLE